MTTFNNLMNRSLSLLALAGAATLPLSAFGADHMDKMSPKEPMASASVASPMAAADMTDGVIRKIDKSLKKITIKHGEIKNLEMPGMTMVFQVKDESLLDKAKVGDAIKFHAEKQGGSIVVTDIQPAQ
ncbi:MAG: copper-binding protein [Pseudomonadota bacterium]|uniref:copper-binding protein n=1 Tax=Aquabacterium sp. CECT 9606 TaxID=2845822 RepID=UPI001E655858|nr:copper-binding protein [Aquabacterium sp. CECT 9606]CAH0353343.1 hypothetical protein AQB9606_03183 [Aquabacterium sp. CECT 9606]